MTIQTLTEREVDVLLHTSRTGRYVTGEALVLDMAKRGLLFSHGAQRLAGGAHYLTMTVPGREALNAWKAAQPQPEPVKKRRRSKAFQAWRDYCEANGRYGFREFLTNTWPEAQRRGWY